MILIQVPRTCELACLIVTLLKDVYSLLKARLLEKQAYLFNSKLMLPMLYLLKFVIVSEAALARRRSDEVL